MEDLYTSTLTEITEKEVIAGTVVGITDKDVIVNIGFKSDGLVPLSEFRDMENELKAGDEVQVYLEELENANGQLILSRSKAKIVKAWENIQKGYEEDLVIDGMVKRRTKGGLIVDIYGVEAFLPGSQIDVKPIRDFDVFVNKKMQVKVVKINYTNDNVVVSHKVLIENDLEQQKTEILNNLEKGQVLEGVIKNMTNFGVFIDLGGVDGLLYITDISWGRISHPSEVLQLNQKINVAVLDFDENKKRISLGLKQLLPHVFVAIALVHGEVPPDLLVFAQIPVDPVDQGVVLVVQLEPVDGVAVLGHEEGVGQRDAVPHAELPRAFLQNLLERVEALGY